MRVARSHATSSSSDDDDAAEQPHTNTETHKLVQTKPVVGSKADSTPNAAQVAATPGRSSLSSVFCFF